MNGSNYIEYTSVEAYGVAPLADGIISGGGGDSITVVESATFYWVYDPNAEDGGGFTGGQWYCEVPNTPLANISQDQLLAEFAAGTRTNLDAEFIAWQGVVNKQPEDADYVKDFMEKVGFDCFSTH